MVVGEPPGAGDATELFAFLCLFVSGPNDAIGQVALRVAVAPTP